MLCKPFLVALGQPTDVAHTSAHYAQVQHLGDDDDDDDDDDACIVD